MANRAENVRRIPRFKSYEEEAEFWDTHSPLDFPEVWKEAKSVKSDKPIRHVLQVRLDARTITQLFEIGRAQGVGPATLAQQWLLERLAAETPSQAQPEIASLPARRA